MKETKSIRLQLLIKPSTKKALLELAEAQEDSLNNYINIVLEQHIKAQRGE